MAAIIFLFSCSDENTVPREYPRISLPEITNITPAGATFVAEVISAGSVPISQHGFVWGYSRTLNEDYGERIYLGSFSGKGSFQADISTTLEAGRSYYVSAFIKAGDYTVYSEPVQFTSLGSQAPVVTGFSPLSAVWGDTILIHGKNFSWKTGSNIVTFGPVTSYNLLSITDTLIKSTLPEGVVAKRSAVSVSIAGNKATVKNDSLNLIFPEINDFYPKSARWGDTITLRGKHFERYLNLSKVKGIYFNDLNASLCKCISDTIIKTVVPLLLPTPSNQLSIKFDAIVAKSKDSFSLLPPVIENINPNSETWGATIVLHGKFDPLSSMNTITIGGTPVAISGVSDTTISIVVPSSLSNYSNIVELKTGQFKVTSPEPFYLKKPVIKYFTPSTGTIGSKIKVGGRYFKQGSTSVTLGKAPVDITSLSDSVITFNIPFMDNGNYRIKVNVANMSDSSQTFFTVLTPQNLSITSPTTVSYDDLVTVKGENLIPGMTWYLGNSVISVNVISSTDANFRVPYIMFFKPLILWATYTANGVTHSVTANQQLTLKDFTITSVAPLEGKATSTVNISGENFNPTYSQVYFGSNKASIISATTTNITVAVPYLPVNKYDISVSFGDRTHVYSQQYFVNSMIWGRLDDLPFLYDYGCVFDFGEDIYVATADISPTQKALYKFDIDTKGFSKLPVTFSSSIVDPLACTLNGKGYILGQKSTASVGFEVFVPDSMIWRKLPDYPGTKTAVPFIIADDSVIYAGSGRTYNSGTYYKDFWKYSPKTNKWKQLANIPSLSMPSNQAFINGNLLFATTDKILYKYNPSNNSWTNFGTTPFSVLGGTASVFLNGEWYICFGDYYGTHSGLNDGNTNIIYIYNPTTKSWRSINNPPLAARTMPLYFTAGGYLYIGGSQRSHLYDFWEFDPTVN